jgi:hypothetical protein
VFLWRGRARCLCCRGELSNLLVQLSFIIPSNFLMHKDEIRAKQRFANIMAIRFAAAVHRDLLYTLIPPSVLKFVTDQTNNSDSEPGPDTSLFSAQVPLPRTQNPKHKTCNPKPETRNPTFDESNPGKSLCAVAGLV